MSSQNHLSEDTLISFHLHEEGDDSSIRRHLEHCPECAALSDSIAHTLRVFSAEPVPDVDLSHNWQKLRGNLNVLTPAPRRSLRLFPWLVSGLTVAALVVLLFITLRPKHTPVSTSDLASIKNHGPLTAAPADPEIANQLDNAERLLTEVNHASGPLDETTRTQAHELLLKNAVYIRSAHDRGDLGTASILENLGRVLTNIDHESVTDHGGWHLRFELNTDGLLLDIRILRQNEARL